MSTECVTVLAPAKLNLALAVGPRAGDGMHPICSWMVTLDLADELLVTRLPMDRFSRYAILWHDDALRRSEIDWSISDDLAVRAHLALETHLGRKLPIQLKLSKRIPVSGGLGGGSANAAAMLHALNGLFALGRPVKELAEIGAKLGSDVPFLVHGGSAIVEGLGERVTPHGRAPALDVVLVFPDRQCATGVVYKHYDDRPATRLETDAVRMLAASVIDAGGGLRPDAPFNDLARAAVRASPGLDGEIALVSAIAERPAHVCGSGSSIFVLCDGPTHAGFLAKAITRRHGLPAVPARTTAPAWPPAGAGDLLRAAGN